MDVRQLNAFRAVARTLNFTQAAAALDYAQSSVTEQVRALEAELGTPLFDRLGRRVALTEAGRRLLPYAERLLSLADEARAVVTPDGEVSGDLTIGALETLCACRLPPVLARLRARHPRVQVRPRPGTRAELRRAVADGLMDAALTLGDPLTPGPLASDQLHPETLVFVAHPAHPLAQRPSVGPADLAGEPFLVTEVGCSYRALVDRTLGAGARGPTVAAECSSVGALKACVVAGMGLTLLPEVAVVAELAQGQIAALQWAGPGYSAPLRLTYHAERWMSPALRAFLDLARTMLGTDDDATQAQQFATLSAR